MEQTEKLSTEKVGSKPVPSSPTSFHESSMEQKKTLEAPNTSKHSLETSASPLYLYQPSIKSQKAFVPPNKLVKRKTVPSFPPPSSEFPIEQNKAPNAHQI